MSGMLFVIEKREGLKEKICSKIFHQDRGPPSSRKISINYPLQLGFPLIYANKVGFVAHDQFSWQHSKISLSSINPNSANIKLENVLFSLSRIKDSKTPSHLLRVNQPKLKLNTAQPSLFIPLGGKFLLVNVSIKHSQNLNKQMYPVHIRFSPGQMLPGQMSL